MNSKSLVLDLTEYKKSTTPNCTYRQLYAKLAAEFKSDGSKFIFTDGSKTTEITSYAVTEENGSTISLGILPDFASVFTSEAFAILQATKAAAKLAEKHVICSDSISVINAIQNTNNNTEIISEIRYQLIKSKNVKLMVTPGHVGISGNEYADSAANSAKNRPVFNFNIFTKTDLQKYTAKLSYAQTMNDWGLYRHHYKDINPLKSTPMYILGGEPSILKVHLHGFQNFLY